MEKIDLSTPIQAPSITTYTVMRLEMDWPNGTVHIGLADQLGGTKSFSYTGASATTMIKALNTSNFSVKSLQKRILEQLVSDGKLDGVISGVPDS